MYDTHERNVADNDDSDPSPEEIARRAAEVREQNGQLRTQDRHSRDRQNHPPQRPPAPPVIQEEDQDDEDEEEDAAEEAVTAPVPQLAPIDPFAALRQELLAHMGMFVMQRLLGGSPAPSLAQLGLPAGVDKRLSEGMPRNCIARMHLAILAQATLKPQKARTLILAARYSYGTHSRQAVADLVKHGKLIKAKGGGYCLPQQGGAA